MSRFIPLNTNSDFRRCYGRGKVYTNPALVIYVLRNRAGICRIGITTSKKIGNAVERNRARRVIRAAAERLPDFSCGCDIVFVARSRTIRTKSTDIYTVMMKQLTAAGLIGNEK